MSQFPATLDSFHDIVDRHDGEDIAAEPVTVPATSPYVAWLRQVPKPGTNVTADGITRVPWGKPLAEGQFSLRDRDAKLQFHSSLAGNTYAFDYTGIGSPYRAKEINDLARAIEAIQAFVTGSIALVERHTYLPGLAFQTPAGQHVDRYAFDNTRIGLARLVALEISAPTALATVTPTQDTILEIGTDPTYTDPEQAAQVTLPADQSHVLATDLEVDINVNLDQQLYLRLLQGDHEHLQIRAQIAILDTPAE